MKLYLHSIIDVTTNSSSEMFVCDTRLSVKKVKKVLKALFEAYILAKDLDHEGFDSVFGSVRIATKRNREIAETHERYDREQEERLKDDPILSLINANLGRGKVPVVGKDIVVYSASDNTIPYELFDVIQHSFNAGRYHLG